jgi:thiol-disulfide isomerase/thioredoxin
MKKASYFALCMTILACGCSFRDGGFVIKGSIEGKNACLVSAVPGTTDTLATGASKNGKIRLTGKVDKPVIARLIIEGEEMCTLLLENGNTYVLNNGRIEATTEAQKRLDQFDDALQAFTSFRARVVGEALQIRSPADSIEFQNRTTPEANRLQDRLSDLVKADPDSELTAYFLYTIKLAGGDISKLVDLLGENAKATAYGKVLTASIPGIALLAAMRPAIPVGEIAPDFTLPTPNGKPLSLHGVKARLKLIDFWASWCGPCRAENPNVLKVYAEYHPKGLEIIGVSLDSDRAKWVKAIEDDHLTWLHVSDLQGWQTAPTQLYGVYGVPSTVLVDENNKIIAHNLRGDALRVKIAELLD